MNRVLNQQTDDIPPDAVQIGPGSLWNNPFRMGFDGDRATVLAKHERWLAEQDHLFRALDDLGDRDLVCCCAPLPCHGDLLLRLAAASRDEWSAWRRGVLAS